MLGREVAGEPHFVCACAAALAPSRIAIRIAFFIVLSL
jgi:hypothetical protein